jgi:uncharacterized membrane protein (DUF2068 family)
MHLFNTIRAVALYEAAKGTLVVLTGFGALSLIHRDAQQFAERLVAHMHLNPAKHYPRIFLDAAANLTETHLLLLAAFAASYGLVRFIEAYGLWYGRRWAEWFAAVSGAIYIPFEIYELFHRVSWLSLSALVLNVLVVALMVNVLYRVQPADNSKTN